MGGTRHQPSEPVELGLAANLHTSILSYVAGDTCKKYESRLKMFGAWCGSLAEQKVPLTASHASVTMYL
jgi:hypothetical protein